MEQNKKAVVDGCAVGVKDAGATTSPTGKFFDNILTLSSLSSCVSLS
jgi:hypothetical protein